MTEPTLLPVDAAPTGLAQAQDAAAPVAAPDPAEPAVVPETPAPVAVDPSPAPKAVPTQVKKPWRATVRTIFAMLVGAAALAPVTYLAATNKDPQAASGDAALALAIAASVTRVLAVPAVERFLQRWFPWLSADTPDWHAGL